jgi:hypothetical protein
MATSSKVPWRLGVGGSDKQNYTNKTSKAPVVGKPSPPYRNGTFSVLEV